MGALHEGHLKLIQKSLAECDFTVVSIFVNPSQFNNPEDLKLYPRNETEDRVKLQKAGCSVLFLPSVDEIYPNGYEYYTIELGTLDQVLEGKYRPGHFKGVAMVVERLFRIVEPQRAFFGEKDFQQIAVIRRMVQLRKLDVEIRTVATVRSSEGLALSSRNARLSAKGRDEALIIHKTLLAGKTWINSGIELSAVRKKMLELFAAGNLELEYLCLADERSLEETESSPLCRAFIAAYCEGVRLIDTMKMTD